MYLLFNCNILFMFNFQLLFIIYLPNPDVGSSQNTISNIN